MISHSFSRLATPLFATPLSRRQALFLGLRAASVSLITPVALATPAQPSLDAVTLATNWYAEVEHGGFYQALATGIYERYGLKVTIKMGGAGVNVLQLLVGGAADFAIGSSLDALTAVESAIPLVTVAAIFQKDPQILMAHPGVGHASLASLKGKPIYASAGANVTYWPFLRSRFGFTDDQKRPYTSSMSPFLLDPASAQQGYLITEPLRVRQQGGFDPVVYWLADYGYNPYACTIETTRKTIQTQPDRVQRFVTASLQGWQSYLQNPQPGNQLIQQANPQMTQELLAYGIAKLKEYSIVTGGDAARLGIGAMTEQRWQEQFQTMVQAKLLQPSTPYQNAFTLQFVTPGSSVGSS
jgi:NitT/TauT family transport system substrate-binding protein